MSEEGRRGIRILLAEDSRVVREELARELRSTEGVAEVVAVDGVGPTRDALRAHDFDICVLDFQLSDGTALDILRESSRSFREHGTVVIVLTSSPSSMLHSRCLLAGADHFFAKPDDLDRFRLLIAQICRSIPPTSDDP